MKEIRFYKGDKLIISFGFDGVGDKIVKDNFVLFIKNKGMPVLVKDGKRYNKYDRVEVVDDRR